MPTPLFPLREYWQFFRAESAFLSYGLGFTFFSSFGQTFLISLFVPYFLIEFQLDGATFGTLYASATLVGAILLPWAGRGLDRMALDRYTTMVVLLLAASAFTLASARTIPVLLLALVGVRLAGQSLAFQTAVTAMARQYAVSRGKALSIATLGLPLGEAALPLAVLISVTALGWRGSWVLIGTVSLLAFAPLLLVLLHRSGQELDPRRRGLGSPAERQASGVTGPDEPGPRLDLTPEGPAGEGPMTPFHPAPDGWRRREVLGDARFWLILPAALLPPFWATGLFLYQTNIAAARGWSLSLMAAAFGAFALTRVVCSVAVGSLVDRLTARRIFPYTVLPLGAALGLLLHDGGWVPFAFMALLGTGIGFGGTVKGALWAELYGIRHLGAIKSMMATFMVIGTAAAPVVIGVVVDDAARLPAALVVGVVSVLVAAAMAVKGLSPHAIGT